MANHLLPATTSVAPLRLEEIGEGAYRALWFLRNISLARAGSM